ncbi:hypothetical protein EV1_011900 [Malus domestica]
MGRNKQEKDTMNGKLKDIVKAELKGLASGSSPNSPTEDGSPRKDGRPSSIIVKANTMFPAHLIAEAISSPRGLDLRWSGPITPSEMLYVQQYIFAKYPEYYNDVKKLDIDNLSINEETSGTPPHDNKLKSPKSVTPKELSPFSSIHSDLDRTKMEPSRLLDILTKKSSFQGNFVSIHEVQARNRALKQCGLQGEDYLVLFMSNYKDAMVMISESYPFFIGNYYITIVGEKTDKSDPIRDFASTKESRVISAPETWLDLRIKGSQLSQYFRRKCKYSPR